MTPGRSGVPLDDLVKVVFEAVADGNDLFTDIDLVAGDRIDMGKRNDKAAMYADEFFRGQFVREGFEVAKGEDGFGPSPDRSG